MKHQLIINWEDRRDHRAKIFKLSSNFVYEYLEFNKMFKNENSFVYNFDIKQASMLLDEMFNDPHIEVTPNLKDTGYYIAYAGYDISCGYFKIMIICKDFEVIEYDSLPEGEFIINIKEEELTKNEKYGFDPEWEEILE